MAISFKDSTGKVREAKSFADIEREVMSRSSSTTKTTTTAPSTSQGAAKTSGSGPSDSSGLTDYQKQFIRQYETLRAAGQPTNTASIQAAMGGAQVAEGAGYGAEVKVGDRISVGGQTITVTAVDRLRGQITGATATGGAAQYNAQDLRNAGYTAPEMVQPAPPQGGTQGGGQAGVGGQVGGQAGGAGQTGGQIPQPGATFTGTNPFRAPARPSYDPKLHGPPLTLAEANIAEAYLRTRQNQFGDIIYVDPLAAIELGGAPGYQWASTQEPVGQEILAQYFAMQDMEAAITDLRINDLEAEQELSKQRLDFQSRQQMAYYEEQLRQNASQYGNSQQGAALKAQAEAALQQIQYQAVEERYTVELQHNLGLQTLDRQMQIQQALLENQQEFQREQSALDRALRATEMQEASRAAKAQETLQASKYQLELQQFKVSTFAMLSSQPEMLYFLGQVGGAGMFADVLGEDTANTLNELLERMNQTPPINIQQFARLGGAEQAQQAFAYTARTGVGDVSTQLRGEAPQAGRNAQYLAQPVLPGAGSSGVNFRSINLGGGR